MPWGRLTASQHFNHYFHSVLKVVQTKPLQHKIDYYYIRLESRSSGVLTDRWRKTNVIFRDECVNLFLNTLLIWWMQLACLTLRTLVNTEVCEYINTSPKNEKKCIQSFILWLFKVYFSKANDTSPVLQCRLNTKLTKHTNNLHYAPVTITPVCACSWITSIDLHILLCNSLA